MMNTIGKYVQSIAMVMIFTTFINLIMPEGDFRKYIKIVLGLIIIITILGPINTFVFKNRPSYTDLMQKYELEIESGVMKSQDTQYLDLQKDIILENYEENLKPQMIGIIEKRNEVVVLGLEIDFNQDIESDQFGDIVKINMVVEPRDQDDSKQLIKIPSIKVGTKSLQNTEENNEQIGGQMEENIKTSLIDFYNLPDANINITVQKNS